MFHREILVEFWKKRYEDIVLHDPVRAVLIKEIGFLLVHIKPGSTDLVCLDPLKQRLAVNQCTSGGNDYFTGKELVNEVKIQ